jgi:Cutinase
MNTLIRRLALATAAASALAVIPLATAARAATAPDPCAVPMTVVGGGNGQVYYRASCSSPAVQVTSGPGVTEAVLMPGGRDVAAIITNTGLEIINIATKAVTVMPQAEPLASASKSGLSVAPDGSAIAYNVANGLGSNLGTAAGIYAQRLDGSPAYRVSPTDSNAAGYTAWSHDGRYIAYTTSTIADSIIAYAPASGGGPETVAIHGNGSDFENLAWTPDDKGLLTTTDTDTSQPDGHLLYGDLATGTLTPVLTDPGRQFQWGQLSVDQHWDVFLGSYKYPVAGSNAEPVRIDAAWLGNPSTIIPVPLASAGSDDWDPSVSTAGPADPRPAGFPAPGSPAPTPTPTPTPTPIPVVNPPGCPQVELFGLRGTRSSPWDTSVDDAVTSDFAAAIKQDLWPDNTTVKFVPVGYAATLMPGGPAGYGPAAWASGGYQVSVDAAVQKLLKASRKFQRHCPASYEAMVGYSQGQQVVREAFALMPRSEQQRVAFIVGYGDPLFSATQQPKIDQGDYDGHLGGIFYAAARVFKAVYVPDVAIPVGPPDLTPRVQDWCRNGDVICNFSWTNVRKHGLAQHTRYAGTDYITQAAEIAARTYHAVSGH